MNLRKLFVCAVASIAMFSTTTLLQAQEGQKGKGGRGGGMMSIERLEEAVGKLSADQKTKIEAVLAKQREAMQGMQNLAQEERQAKMREAGQKFRTEIRAVLTAEQQKKFDEMPTGRGQGGGGGKKKDQ